MKYLPLLLLLFSCSVFKVEQPTNELQKIILEKQILSCYANKQGKRCKECGYLKPEKEFKSVIIDCLYSCVLALDFCEEDKNAIQKANKL